MSEPAWRFYLLPIERVQIYHGPKYFAWRYDPDPPGIDTMWSMKRYYLSDTCLICGHVGPADHERLVAQRDVFAFPVDLDERLDITWLARVCRKSNIPFSWVNKTWSGRKSLRFLAAVFHFSEAMSRRGGRPADWPVTLANKWCELSAAQKGYIKDAAAEYGYDCGFISVSTTIEGILLGMARQWGLRNVSFKYVDVDARPGR